MLTTSFPDKQHTLWLHGNTLLHPINSVTTPNINNASSDYAEVSQIMPTSNITAPPEAYATVNTI